MKRSKRSASATLFLALFSLAVSVVNVFVQAWTLSTLWRWFLAAQYGDGPHFGCWYGIATIAHLLTYHLMPRPDDDDDDEANVAGKTVGRLVVFPLTLGITWLVGITFGWL